MNHCDEDAWKATEFDPIGRHIDRPDLYDPPRPDLFDPEFDQDFYKPGFKEWLHRRPLVWRRLVSSALRASQHKEFCHFSVLTLIQILLFQSTEDDPYYLCRFDRFDYCFVSDLGQLLMAFYPETAQMLVNGESSETANLPVDISRFVGCSTANLPASLVSELEDLHDVSEHRLFP